MASPKNNGDEFNFPGDHRHSTIYIITRVGIGLVAIAAALVIASLVFNVGPLVALLPTPIPSPTPLAFPTPTAGESLIIVADSEDRSDGKYQGIDPAQYIYEQLTAQAKKDNLDVRIERLRHTVDDNTVRPTGETYSATLVLWGWYDALTITPRVERIKIRSDYQSTEEGTHFSLADPTKIEFSVVTDLPSQASYVTLLALGLDQDAGGNSDAALAYYNSATLAVPSNANVTTVPAEAYFARSLIYHGKGDYDRAIADYNKVIQLRPDFVAAYNNRGFAYYNKGDYDRAIADYDKAIQLKPDDAGAYNDRGVAYHHKGDYDRAIADYDKVIQLKPDWAPAYNNRGNVYASKGDYDRAIADYNQAIQLKPDYVEAYYNRGLAYKSKGNKDRAIADFKKALDLSNDPNVRQLTQNQLKSLGAQ